MVSNFTQAKKKARNKACEHDTLSFSPYDSCMQILWREGKYDRRLVDTHTLSEEKCFLSVGGSLPAAQYWLKVEKAASLHWTVAKGTASILWHYGQIRRK